jgi:NAD(P)-dependent dehydrogenase (short-subunit alcohol dehydrogenase family)
VANKMAVQTMHYEILDKWGRVDVLINNAAVEPLGTVLTMDEWAWDRTFNVNLKGAFLCTQTVARGMKEQGGGVILNIGGANTGHDPHAAFAASKAGLMGFTQECAKELADYGIRVALVEAHNPTDIDVFVEQVVELVTRD